MQSATTAQKAAINGNSLVYVRILAERSALFVPVQIPLYASDSKRLYVLAAGPIPDGKLDNGEILSMSYSSSCSDGDIGIGTFCAASINVSVSGVYHLNGSTLRAQYGVEVSGSINWFDLGWFTVTDCTVTDHDTTFTGYDASYSATKAYNPTVSSGATAAQVLADVCSQCGLEAQQSTLNMGQNITVTGTLTGRTCNEMIGYMAGLCGKNAVFDRDGRVKFVWYTSSGEAVTPDLYYSGEMQNRGASTLYGITCTATGDDGDITLTVGDTSKAIEYSNPYMTQSRLNAIWSTIGGYSYPMGNVGFYRGALTEPGDIVALTNITGVTVQFPCMQVDFEFDGGCKCTVSSFGKSDNERMNNSKTPVMQAIEEVKEVAEDAAENAASAMTSANGKNKVFHQSTAPTTADGLTVGDIWFDTANDYRMNTWTGSAWSAFELGEDAIANLSITNAKIANATIEHGKIASLDMGKATVGKLRAQFIDVDNLFAQDITATGTITGAKLLGSKITTNSSNFCYVTVEDNCINFYDRNLSTTTPYLKLTGTRIYNSTEIGDLWIKSGFSNNTVEINVTGAIFTGLGNSFAIETFTEPITVGANSTANGSFDVEPIEGTAIGIVGWQFPDSGSSYLFLPRLYLQGTTCYWLARNTTGSAYSGNLEVSILKAL